MVLCALAYFYKIIVSEMVLVIEFTSFYIHAVMHTLVSFVVIYLAFMDRLNHGNDLISRAH